jgi:hypothetical protein
MFGGMGKGMGGGGAFGCLSISTFGSHVFVSIATSSTTGDHFGHTGQPSKELGAQVARVVMRDFENKYANGIAQPRGRRRRGRRGGKRTLRTAA